ncbi:MAG: anaerobic ribonucleoside-triphosphate reductase activating protein [Oscillospiraceae bacterium]
MKIGGLQKLTLLDYPQNVAATVFFEGCNFRCPFCHNASLVIGHDEENYIDQKDFFAFLEKRHGILDGVCITGGEPLINVEIFDFIAKIKAMGFKVKLDTNGSFPDRLKFLLDEGMLDYIAMDIKNSKEKYGFTSGVKEFNINPIEKSVEILMNGKAPYEFRTTFVREHHQAEDVEKIGAWIKGALKYRLQGFVDSGNLIGSGQRGFSYDEMQEFKKIAQKYIPDVEIRGY